MSTASKAALSLLDTVMRHLSHAERREGQADMVRHVADAIQTGSTLVVQAGTGTGKTLGYLVPILAAGRTAVIATYTKALQDQLASVDLPLLEAACADTPDLAFSWAVLKGRTEISINTRWCCLRHLVASSLSPRMSVQGPAAAHEVRSASRNRRESALLMPNSSSSTPTCTACT